MFISVGNVSKNREEKDIWSHFAENKNCKLVRLAPSLLSWPLDYLILVFVCFAEFRNRIGTCRVCPTKPHLHPSPNSPMNLALVWIYDVGYDFLKFRQFRRIFIEVLLKFKSWFIDFLGNVMHPPDNYYMHEVIKKLGQRFIVTHFILKSLSLKCPSPSTPSWLKVVC